MKQLGWTSLEQSTKLIEAGLEPDTADMYYFKDQISPIYENANYNNIFDLFNADGMSNNLTPCWSLGALIELVSLPLFIAHDDEWFVTIDTSTNIAQQFSSKTLIGALCEAIEWLVENNYIKKGD